MLSPARMDPSRKTEYLPTRLLLAGIVTIGLGGRGQSSGAGTGAGGLTGRGAATSPSGGSGGTVSGRAAVGDGDAGGTISTGSDAVGRTTDGGGVVASGGINGVGDAPGAAGATGAGSGGSGLGGSGGASTKGTGSTGMGGAFGTGSGNAGGSTGVTGGAGTEGMGSSGGSGDAGKATIATGGLPGTGGATPMDASSGDSEATIVPDPSWTCGMPDGIPPPTSGTLAFSVSLTISAIHDVGNTQFGRRRQLDISGGTITGDRLNGTVLTGGLDYELTLSTGAMELEEILILKTSDNTTIFTRICGVAAPADASIRIVPDIEAPTASSYAWLNTATLVGTRAVDAAGSTITLQVYDVSNGSAGGTRLQLVDPAGVPNVSWDCVTASGTDGSSVFRSR